MIDSEAKNDGDIAMAPPPASELEQVKAERDKYLDLARRTQAEFENYQKRAARDRDQERRFAQWNLAAEILPALDNLDRSLANVKEDSELRRVVAAVRTQLLEGLKRQGILPIAAVGQPFDPNLHEAVMQQPARDKAPGTVLSVLESGYQYHDRVLRPAKVIVAKSID
jgi:molecular chaperone GrpE